MPTDIEVADLTYIRTAGEAVRQRLFPVPKADGRKPLALPVHLRYEMPGQPLTSVLFTPLRSAQQLTEIDGQEAEPGEYEVMVVAEILVAAETPGGYDTFKVTLEFGCEPDLTAFPEHLRPLLRAVAGAG